LLSGAEDLVPKLTLQPDGTTWQRERLPPREEDGEIFTIDRYRPRIEGLLARIERWTNQKTGDVHWRSTSKENIQSVYGRTENSRIFDPADHSRIFSWLLDETADAKGNLIRYQYKAEDLTSVDPTHSYERNHIQDPIPFVNRYLKRIFYGNDAMFRPENWLFEIVFDYGEHDGDEPQPSDNPANSNSQPWLVRQDPFSTYRAGFDIRTYRLCRRLLMFHHIPELSNQPYLVRSTDLDYEENPILTRLISITHAGYVRQSETAPYHRKAMPPVEFTYSRAELHQEIQELDPESLENLPAGLGGPGYQLVDLNGEGISGILSEQGGAWFYKSGLGNATFAPNEQNAHPPAPPAMAEIGTARFGSKQVVAAQPGTATLLQTGGQLLDLAGDGKLDVVQFADPLPGFYERTAEGDWESFRAFQDVPNVAWQDPNLKFIDLTGDGHADILITEQEVFTWHPSEAEAGFGPAQTVRKVLEEERGPALVFADRTQTIFVADMSGDGLNDLVRIRNGDIAYWPNMGYGRFGAKITMDQAPVFDHPELFDPQRLRLADIDGSGTTDLLYLGRETVTIWANQAGNGWGQPQTVDQVPPVDTLSNVSVADILGNGTACLVWSSPLPGHAHQPVRYIDLMGTSARRERSEQHPNTGKPHLLISIRNNLGAETRMQYAPSTRHYLEDRANGQPWLTKLPFPVHVVERVEMCDWIQQTKFVSLYRYHHGFFDGVEREFHGFAMVEQWDSEKFPPFRGRGLFPVEPANAEEEGLHQPPVYTKTWFHTGAFLEGPSLARQLTAEYWREDPHFDLPAEGPVPPDTPPFLPDTDLPAGLTAEETRQAVRALKGQLLRQEVYAVDNTPAAPHPYTVSERNYELKLLQPMMDNPYAVFYPHPREALAFQYERRPEDPRVTHQITLAVDEHCNITDSVAIGYPRRNPAFTEQGALQITYTKADFINQHDEPNSYFIGVPFQTRTYEVTGIPWAWTETPFRWLEQEAFVDVIADPDDFLPYEEPPLAGAVGTQKRLIEWSRSYFRQDEEPELLDPPGDLTHRLPLGDIASLALPYESYTAAFTDAQVAQAFEGRVTEAMLSSVDEGAYHRETDQADYWWIPSGKQAFDDTRFFVPTRIQDPFGNITTVDYDPHVLMPIRIEDPVGNIVQATLEYRVLQPREVIDPNQNHTRAAFDALGMVVGTAVIGKITGNVGESGDSLEGFLADLEESTISEFTTDTDDPAQLALTLLGTATTRLINDLDRYHNSRQINDDGTETGQPVVVATIARETHVNALPPGAESRLQLSFHYSDGLEREVQAKVQAEPGPLDLDDPSVPILDRRWVGTGCTVYNNKGNPIKQYEPFFSPTHHMETEAALVEHGVTPVLHYDPLSRLIRTDLPDGSFTQIIFDSWHQETWDQNDTVLESRWYTDRGRPDPAATEPPSDPDQRAAFLAAQHAQSPAIAHLDTLGRTFRTIGDNGERGQIATHVTLDIEGNPLVITDARENQVETNVFDIAGRNIRKHSMDSGTRWTLTDVAGTPIRLWDSRNHQFRFVYDALRRPTHRFVQTDSSGAEILLERMVYGETHHDPEASNLRGQMHLQADGAGFLTNQRFDFKGNLQEKTRRLAVEFRERVNWVPLADLTDLAHIEDTTLSQTEDEEFSHRTTYDALNRPTSLITPDGSDTQPTYNEANLLERVAVRIRNAQDSTSFVNNIDYNARGQRIAIEYQNGVATRYTYDDFTFRLVRLLTTRLSDNRVLQDLHFTYDPVGNITELLDDAQEPIFFANQEVLPRSRYEYDALYQLVLAEGREHIGQNLNEPRDHREDPPIPTPDPTDVQAMRNYTEHYFYDAVGNILRMQHVASNGSWTRHYAYASESNRLLATSLPVDNDNGPFSATYEHDAHGNMTRVPHLPGIAYDLDDQMQRCDLQGGGQVFFVYDAAGQRVRKVHEHNGSTVDERMYLGGYEIFRRRVGGTQHAERETLHVMDETKRIALVESLTLNDGATIADPVPRQRYQYTNHLESAMLELNGEGQTITYEEYHPYGTTSYHAVSSNVEVSSKRYRYTGKERDEETGLYYHGARYYAPWLGRWTAADPIGLADGANLYSYVSNNPIVLSDQTGNSKVEPADTYSREAVLVDDNETPITGDKGITVITFSDDPTELMTKEEKQNITQLETKRAPIPDWLQRYNQEHAKGQRVIDELPDRINRTRGKALTAMGVYTGILFLPVAAGEFALAEGLGATAFWGAAGAYEIDALQAGIHSLASDVPTDTEYRHGLRTALSIVMEESDAAKYAYYLDIATAGAFLLGGAFMGTEGRKFRVPISQKLSNQAQGRHLARPGQAKSYLRSSEDAKKVLDAYHAGKGIDLGLTAQGHILFKYRGVTGFNVNRSAGYMDQPTNVFELKGTSKVSVVPTSPRSRPSRNLNSY
jgi:RHS repeat-associated protein